MAKLPPVCGMWRVTGEGAKQRAHMKGGNAASGCESRATLFANWTESHIAPPTPRSTLRDTRSQSLAPCRTPLAASTASSMREGCALTVHVYHPASAAKGERFCADDMRAWATEHGGAKRCAGRHDGHGPRSADCRELGEPSPGVVEPWGASITRHCSEVPVSHMADFRIVWARCGMYQAETCMHHGKRKATAM